MNVPFTMMMSVKESIRLLRFINHPIAWILYFVGAMRWRVVDNKLLGFSDGMVYYVAFRVWNPMTWLVLSVSILLYSKDKTFSQVNATAHDCGYYYVNYITGESFLK